MADSVGTDDIAGYGAYLKSQGTSDSDIQGYTKYLADQHGVDHPAEADPSWLDKSFLGHTPRDVIQGGLNALPTIGMVGGGLAGAETGPGAIATAGMGAAGGQALKNLGEQYILGQDKTRSDIYGDTARAGVDGANAEMGGKLLGAGISAAANTGPGQAVLGGIKDSAKWAAGKVGRIFASVPEDTTARYISNPSIINNAPSRDQINDQVLNLKNNAQDQLDKAQEDLVNAKGDASDKKQSFREALKNTNLTSMVGNVTDAIGKLKDSVVKGSQDAYKTLFKADGKVETKPLVNLLQNHIDSMTVNGVPASSSAEQSIKEIKAMQDRLNNMGTHVYMPQAKQILQGLDKDINYSNSVGSFAPQTDHAFSSLRTAIDEDVKTQVSDYKAKMINVSRQTRLLNAASDNFGTPEKAISNLNNISSQKGQAVHLPIIEALGQETGQDLSTPVNDFLTKQKVLSTPSLFEKHISELPESKAVTAAQEAVDTAKSKSDLFKGITPQSITSKTKALGGANNYGAEATLAPIDEAHGTNLQSQIQARNDADQFSKTDTNGSRKTMLGTVVGGSLGLLSHGVEGGAIGASVGANVGHFADKYSGQAFKYGLDKAASLGESASGIGKKVMSTAPSLVGTGASSMLPPNVLPNAASNNSKGPDKWANDGYQNLKSHGTDEDREMLEKYKGALMVDPKAKNLLMTASNYEPGSKPLDDIMKHLKNRVSGDKK